jgi:hypothetical protein
LIGRGYFCVSLIASRTDGWSQSRCEGADVRRRNFSIQPVESTVKACNLSLVDVNKR